MDPARFAVVSAPLDTGLAVRLALGDEAAGNGAVVTFVGAVRGESGGRQVVALEYEAHERLTERVFERIAGEAEKEWPSARLSIHHRVGRLAVGESSIVIAAAAAHRAEAFAACRYAIERVKQVAPIWKREWYDDGDSWVEGAAIDPENEVARLEARRRSCT